MSELWYTIYNKLIIKVDIMKTTDFEKKIQEEIDPELNIRINPNAEDIAGVYWNDIYISVAVPPQEIREEHDDKYHDAIGYPYRHIDSAIELIKGKLPKFKKAYEEEPELFEEDGNDETIK